MSLLKLLARKASPLLVLTQIAMLVGIALVAFCAGNQTLSPALAMALIASTVIGGTLTITYRLATLAKWDKRLAGLNTETLDAFQLATTSGTSPEDKGWNRLVDQGRTWQSLHELETAIARNLSGKSAGNAAALLDAITDGVAAVDGSGALTHVNAVMAAICGKESSQELVGQSLAQALGVDESVSQLFSENSLQSQAAIEWSMAQDGSSRTLRGVRRAIAGSQANYVWTIRDVTQQRLAESMRERFLSAATHEFRTPLANIRAYAESLDLGHDIDAEERKRFYNVIQAESLRLSQLVDDLLDISRMQAGALALELRETDLGRLVEEASSKVAGQMREKNLQFRCELPPKFPKAAVDKSKLTSALINLLGNAAKYTPDGGCVTFRVEIAPQNIQFSITDTGIGIASEELPRVFERFYRSNDDRVRDITGSGLGLALAQEIARLHGGDVDVESTLDKGSTFRLSIPLCSAA